MELDTSLENGGQAMVVEAKVKPDKTDIDEQIDRMEKVRRYADLRGNTRQFFCAMAALTVSDNVIDYALSKGFYLIMPSGEDVKITGLLSEPGIWQPVYQPSPNTLRSPACCGQNALQCRLQHRRLWSLHGAGNTRIPG
jgi:hypothetical protein